MSATRPTSERSVLLLAATRFVSVTGTQAAQLALVSTVYAGTHSTTWIAAILFASAGVSGFIAPAAGLVADRVDRRRVMVLAELGAGTVFLPLTWVHTPLVLVVLALLAGAVNAPFVPASGAALPMLVDDGRLPWANARLGASMNAGLVAGPIVGGALVASSGPAPVFAANAASFALSAAVLGVILPRLRVTEVDHHARAGVLTGLRIASQNATLRALVGASALVFAAFGFALVADLPLAQTFNAGAVGYGLLTSLWGLGAVVGAALGDRFSGRVGEASGFVAGCVAMGISLGSVAILPSFAPIVVMSLLGGLGAGVIFPLWSTLVQRNSDDAVRGRVFAAAQSAEQALFVIGMAVAAPVVAGVGAHRAYAATAIPCVLAALLGSRLATRRAASSVSGDSALVETG